MTKIESQTVEVKNPQSSVFQYLCDMNNFINLLPQDKITDWKSTRTTCSFKIQGAIEIPLEFVSSTPHNHIHIRSGKNAPFPFTLDIDIQSLNNNASLGKVTFNGEMNMFIKMMAEKPLSNLFNYIAQKLSEISM
jgi:carbon monoxide dehydrogenase subunit G